MTKVTYIGHSGFLIETDTCALLFDYYKGTIPEIPAETPLYVFSSHRHHDHFNLEIFRLRDRYPDITYILSHDISPQPTESATFIAPDETLSFPHLKVRTTDSTDEGVSFLVTLTDGRNIFHAGDLNWWTWIGEETEEEARIMEQRFKKEVEKLKPYTIDIAFLPLDPRQQERYYWGYDYYMRTLDIALAYPMHFWDNDKVIDQLLNSDIAAGYRDRIGVLQR